ncbi:MAG TPA: arginase [Vicinamibacterales bacterium]|nr:arginase [Vicinamibacterales bacterium]
MRVPTTMKPAHLIGVPLDLGGNRRGVDMGPSAIRISGLAEQLTALGVAVVDKGDIATPLPETKGPGDPRKRYIKEIAKVCGKLYQTALASLHEGALPIVLGGDHSLGAGSVAATATWMKTRGQALGVIWVDAHADINSPGTSPSGNVHGMPLAALLGREPAELARLSGPEPAIRPEHTVLVGLRNLDDREKEIVKASGAHAFTMKDIDRLGIAEVMERALAAASTGTGGVHVSFDLDVCDPSIAPGVGTPVKGGLDYREAHYVMEAVAESGRLVAFDLVEVNPALDLRNTTAELATDLAMSAFGKRIL